MLSVPAAWGKPALHCPEQWPGTCRTHILGGQALGLDKNVYQQLRADSAHPLAFPHTLHVATHRVQETSFDLSDCEDLLKNIPYLEQPLARAITGHGGPLGFRLLLKTSGCVRFLSFLGILEKSYCSLVTCGFISEKATGNFKINFGRPLGKDQNTYLSNIYQFSSWKLTPKYFLSFFPHSKLISRKSIPIAYKKNMWAELKLQVKRLSRWFYLNGELWRINRHPWNDWNKRKKQSM